MDGIDVEEKTRPTKMKRSQWWILSQQAQLNRKSSRVRRKKKDCSVIISSQMGRGTR
jgi:hypothetical protein